MSEFEALLSLRGAGSDEPRSSADALRSVCVVACSDPGLEEALARICAGVGPVVRWPGPAVLEPPHALGAAVASAVLLHGCTDVVVLGHEGCALTVSEGTSSLAAALARRGLPRGAIPGDLRGFFGLRPSPRALALETAAFLRGLAFLPREVLVHAALLDGNGALVALERGERSAARPAQAPQPSSSAGPAAASGPSRAADPLVGVGLGIRFDIAPAPGLDTARGPTAFEPARFAVTLPFADPAHAATSVAPPPPPSPAPATSAAEPLPTRLAAGPEPADSIALPAGLAEALEKVRAFLEAEVDERARRALKFRIRARCAEGAGSSELAKLALTPVLESGPRRYAVVDALVTIKEAVVLMPPQDCAAALSQMLD